MKNKSIINMLVCALLFSCSTPNNLQNSQVDNKNSQLKDAVLVNTPITGKVEFPNLKFTTKAAVSDVGMNATVSLIYPSDHTTNANNTIATGLTKPDGSFLINSGFKASVGEIFILEANRRIGSTGNALMSLRTFIRWSDSGWESITKDNVFINEKTTALVAMINLLNPAVSSSDAIGKITGTTPSNIQKNGSGPIIINGSSITNTADLVISALSINQDPILCLTYSNGKFTLKDPSPVTNLISTFAGMGSEFTGDGSQATQAIMNYPSQVVRDSSGNTYISETKKNRIRRISTSGIITTFAGTGTIGVIVDSTNAINTQMNNPVGLSIDSSDNIYIADTNNNRILKINSTGTSVSVIAGTGIQGNTLNSTSATNTHLYRPQRLLLDSSSNIYISDTGNYRILKINQLGNNVSVFAGTGIQGNILNSTSAKNSQLSNPFGLAIDSSDNIYVADSNSGRVLKINSTGNNVSVFAGTGIQSSIINSTSAQSSQLSYPLGISIDNLDNVYIADTANSRILKINSTGTSVSIFAGTGSGGNTINSTSSKNTQLSNPSEVSIDVLGNVYVADSNNNRILKMNSTGTSVSVFAGTGAGDYGSATRAYINYPGQVVKDSLGNTFITDTDNYRIRKISTSGIITTFAGTGKYGSLIDSTNATNTDLYRPQGLAVDLLDNIYISDTNNRILKINSTGSSVSIFAGTGVSGSSINSTNAKNTYLSDPRKLAIDKLGNLYITEINNQRILKINSTGTSVSVFAGTGVSGSTINSTSAKNTQLRNPFAVATDSSNNVYVTDTSNQRILKINSTGTSVSIFAGTSAQSDIINTTSATNTYLSYPNGLAIDSSDNLYIADTSNNRILKINSTGTSVSVFAGKVNGVSGFYGDGLNHQNSILNSPQSIFVASDDTVYISDTNNYRVRKVDITKQVAP